VANAIYDVRGFTPKEAEVLAKRYFALQVKGPSLLTERNKNDIILSACVESARYEVLWKSLQWKLRR